MDDNLKDKPTQQDLVISDNLLKRALSKLRPWKAPGPDGVQGFWYKQFSSMHPRICQQLNDILRTGTTPTWITKERTVLIPKDPKKGNIPSNFRPITCLPVIWKIFTGILSDNIYEFLSRHDLLPWEQKGCGKGSRGTKDHLLLDRAVMQDSRSRKTNLTMSWVDYRNTYDMILHSWLKYVLAKMKVAPNIRRTLCNSMEKWSTSLESKGKCLGDVHIKRGIFQGDSLSPLVFVMALIPLTWLLRKATPGYTFKDKTKINHLLYMDDLKLYGKSRADLQSLIHTVRVFSNDIGMTFGLDKCALVVLERGRIDESASNLDMPEGGEIVALDKSSEYKYLGILEGAEVHHTKMKEKITQEYFRRLKHMMKSKLNSGNITKAVNTYAVSVVRYTAGVISWSKEDLKTIDRKTRKRLTQAGYLHPKSDTDRLYVSRSNGGRGLLSVEDVVRKEEKGIADYLLQSDHKIASTIRKALKIKEKGSLPNRRQLWEEKPMNGQFVRQTANTTSEYSWKWLQRGSLKKETESLLIAAQDQALRTNNRRAKIERSATTPLCRLCKEKDETVMHITSACKKLAQKEYKRRHDKVAKAVHWGLCKKFGLACSERWYEHSPETAAENDAVKLLWDMNIYTDRVLDARRPDIVLVKKDCEECMIIDIAIPSDSKVMDKEEEKIEKYQDLAYEIRKMWHKRAKVVPIVIGTLGMVSERLIPFLALLDIAISAETIQKSAVLGTAHILRKVLDIPA